MMPFVLSFGILLWYFRQAYSNEPTFIKKRFRLADILGYIYISLVIISLYFSGLAISEYTFSAIGIVLWFTLMQVEKRVGD